jgi:hypothetical protein
MHDKLVDCKEDEEGFVRRTIVWDFEPLFQVDYTAVLCNDKMTNILDAIENENEEDSESGHATHVPTLSSQALGQIVPQAVLWYQG